MILRTNFILITTMSIVMVGCANKELVSNVTVLEDCHDASTLERDLSDGGTYRGESQLYINPNGNSCRFGS